MVGGIAQMKKEPLFQFRQVEGAGKRGKKHRQETQRVNEFDGSTAEGRDFPLSRRTRLPVVAGPIHEG